MTTREPGASEVLTHGGTVQAFFDGLLGEDAGGDHHGGIGGVGAAGDGGDDDGAVIEILVGIDVEALFHGGGNRTGLEGLV